MSDHKEIDDVSGVETTGHSWDGIRELNNPLPRWWLIIWYATILWAIVYMIFMPAWPALPGLGTNTKGLRNHSDRANVEKSVSEMRAERAEAASSLLTASLSEIEADRELFQFAWEFGDSVFGDNCATCHGANGTGAKGYPALGDDVWLWDGTLEGIEYTIRHGIRHAEDGQTRTSAMPAFGREGLLKPAEIDDLVETVLSFSGRSENPEAAARGLVLFEAQCAVCHGPDGKGDRSLGAPNLTDSEWLYGGDAYEIRNTIYNARNSHMPAWGSRLDETTIKALAVYVHSLGGGE